MKKSIVLLLFLAFYSFVSKAQYNTELFDMSNIPSDPSKDFVSILKQPLYLFKVGTDNKVLKKKIKVSKDRLSIGRKRVSDEFRNERIMFIQFDIYEGFEENQNYYSTKYFFYEKGIMAEDMPHKVERYASSGWRPYSKENSENLVLYKNMIILGNVKRVYHEKGYPIYKMGKIGYIISPEKNFTLDIEELRKGVNEQIAKIPPYPIIWFFHIERERDCDKLQKHLQGLKEATKVYNLDYMKYQYEFTTADYVTKKVNIQDVFFKKMKKNNCNTGLQELKNDGYDINKPLSESPYIDKDEVEEQQNNTAAAIEEMNKSKVKIYFTCRQKYEKYITANYRILKGSKEVKTSQARDVSTNRTYSDFADIGDTIQIRCYNSNTWQTLGTVSPSNNKFFVDTCLK